jgi:hypothetical protein
VAAPTVRDSTAKTADSSTTCVADKPVGTASGDLLIALFDCNNVTANIGTLTLPSGWTQLRRDDHSLGGIFWSEVIAYKTAGGSEPSTYTFTAPAASWWRMAVVGLAGATAIEANQLTYTPSTTATQIPCPSVTTLGADRLLLYFAVRFANTDNGHVPPAGWTELEDLKNTNIGSGSISVGSIPQAAAGASGTFIVTATLGGAATPAAGYTLSVSPAAANPSGTLTKIKWGTGLVVTDEGAGVIRADATATSPVDATTSSKGVVQLAGDLAGTAASPQIAAGVIVDADVATANKDGTAATPSMRTLGTGAQQAAAGNDPRFLRQGARVFNSTNTGITSGSVLVLTFNSERYDTDNIHDPSTNPDAFRLICRTAGKYLIVANVEWAPNASGTRQITIRLNGATGIGAVMSPASPAGLPTKQIATTIYDLAVNDYLELAVYQDSGGLLDIVSSANWSPEFMMSRIA